MDKALSSKQDPSLLTNGPESSFESDEGSFVVLERSPAYDSRLEYLQNTRSIPVLPGTLMSHVGSSMTNMTNSDRPSFVDKSNSSWVTGLFSSDVSPEEIQKRLNEVLQENVSLKETLFQNNLAMKQQLMTLGTWQEEVAKLHQNHKEKFAETKDLILKLRVENEELKKAAQAEPARTGPSACEVADLQREVATLRARGGKREQELSALTEHLNRQLETAERARRQLGVDVERLQAQKTRQDRELATLRGELETQTTRQDRELSTLRGEVETQRQRAAAAEEAMQRQAQRWEPESPEVRVRDREVAAGSSEVGSDCSQPHMASDNEDKPDDVARLRTLLADERSVGEQRAKMLTEAQDQFKKLLCDYQTVVQELGEKSKAQSDLEAQGSSYHLVQVQGFTEKIDRMTAQVLELEEGLQQRDRRLAELNFRMKELVADNETIPVLQIQMQVYQLDFNAEREARENLAGEKERLAEDLRLLQQRNQQLLNQLKLYQQNHAEQLQQSGTVGNGWTTIAAPGRNHPRENTPPSPGPFDQ